MATFKKSDNTPDYLYLDVNAYNYQSINQPSPILQFSQTRNNPVLENSGDYCLSITRFQLDTFNLPTFIAEIEPNQGNRDLTIDTITLEYDDGVNPVYVVQQPVIWEPQNTNIPLPPPPNATASGLQFPSQYYHCYNFKFYIDLVNKALATATASLNAAVGGGFSSLAPFLYWDADRVSATLYADASYYDEENVVPNKINLS